jgi:hypothetical protein
MSATTVTLQGFVYGEHLDSQSQRSLGFRLLAPLRAEAWCQEVEGLARRLQATPYPDHWPATELFCSVLLADGRRLVACVRYGLTDHTPSRRRGGLQMIGIIGPGSLGVTSALAVYHWLGQQRSEADVIKRIGSSLSLADLMAAVPRGQLPADPVPVLPIRLWQDGALLFAATAPSDPNHHLALLEQGTSATWQWLPLVGPDFPLQSYAQRGPLIAWTPHLAGVAVKLDRSPLGNPIRASSSRHPVLATLLFMLLLVGGANLWATLTVPRSVQPAGPSSAVPGAVTEPPTTSAGPSDASGERFARALFHLLQNESGGTEWSAAEIARQYDRLAAADKDLRLVGPDGKEIPEVKEVVVAMSVLPHRSAAKIEEHVRRGLKGYDPRLIQLICQQVREQISGVNADGR